MGFLPNGVTFVSVSDVRRLSARVIDHDVYSFLLTYRDKVHEQRINLVLKTYGKSLDPVFRTYSNCENLERCVKEFQVLRGLERVGFPVPRACLCERDSNVLGYPFIIMQKEEPTQNSTDNIDCFAKNLVQLHSLDITTLGIGALKAPKDMYAFAWRCLLYLKIFLNLYPKHSKELKKDFEFAIRWLESNVSNTRCPKYCLLHGDYRARFNTIMTIGSRMVVMDWEDAEIGDPACDVGIAYARARADFGEKTADRFISEYTRNFQGDISWRLEFYKMVGILGASIYYSSGLSNPIYAYKYHRRKILPTFPFLSGLFILLGFPFIRWPLVARQLAAEGDLLWLKYFENFLEAKLKR